MTRSVRAILRMLAYDPEEWKRPMDVGGFDGSYHSRTLSKLANQGLVERQARYTLRNVLNPKRPGSWEYRITASGLKALEETT